MAKIILKIPKVAVSMQEGTLIDWLVTDGDTVAIGDIIYTLETEKTTIEIECPFAGTITRIGEAGTTYKVGEPVAEIVQ